MNTENFLKIFVFAALLRVAGIWIAPLWYDESFSYLVARLPLDRLIMATAGDVHPPLYYMSILPFARIGIPWLIRVPSVLFSLGLLVAFWRVLKHYRLPVEQEYGAVILMAVIPFQVWYAQEGRMYALLMMLVMLAWLAILNQRIWALVILSAAIMYTHNYGMFYLPALWLAGVARQPRAWRWLTFAIGFGGLLWMPWALVLVQQMADVQRGYWLAAPTAGSIVQIVTFLYGPFVIPIWAGLAVTVALITVSVFGPLMLERPRLDVAIMALCPLVLATVASYVWRPVLLGRGLAGSAPFVMWMCLVPLFSLRKPLERAAAAVVVVPFLVITLAAIYITAPDAKGLAALERFESVVKPGSTVTYNEDGGWINAQANLSGKIINRRVEPCGHDNGGLSDKTRAALGMEMVSPLDASGLYVVSLSPMSAQCSFEQAERMFGGIPPLLDLTDVAVADVVSRKIYAVGGR